MREEKTFISNLIFRNDRGLLIKVLNIVSDDDFITHKLLFQVVRNTILQNKVMHDEFEKYNLKLLDYTVHDIFTQPQIIQKAREIKNKSTSLKIQNLFKEYANFIPEKLKQVVSEFQSKFLNITRTFKAEQTKIKDILVEYAKKQKINKEKTGIIGLSTGIPKLDNLMDGIRRGHFWIIGGNTSSGKTFFSLNILAKLLNQDAGVVFYSLEMNKEDILSRILGIIAQENGTKIFKGQESYDVINAKEQLERSNLSIYSELRDVDDIILSMMEEKIVNGVDVVVIDYLQLLSSKTQRTEYELLRDASTKFQDIAKKLKITIIALSQLSNEAIRNKTSEVLGFKGSGNIGASADLGIELNPQDTKEERDRKLASGDIINYKLNIKKNRHGMVGYINIGFNGQTGVFRELL